MHIFKDNTEALKSSCKVAWEMLSISLFQTLRFHFNFLVFLRISILKLIMCSECICDIRRYLLNAKTLLNTLKHSEEKKPRTSENVEVQEVTHLPYVSYSDLQDLQ